MKIRYKVRLRKIQTSLCSKFLKLLACLVLIIVIWIGVTSPSLAEPVTELPTQIQQIPFVDQQGNTRETSTLMPDWSNISLNSMPPIQSSGSVFIDNQERNWQAGETPDQYLNMGDISETLSAEKFALSNISEITHTNLDMASLSEFPLTGKQTLSQLIEIVPNLGNLDIKEVSPIASLLTSTGINLDGTLTQVLASNPQLSDLTLNTIDLTQFPISSIPNLQNVVLENFQDWQNSSISEIPGLGSVPLNKFPKPLNPSGNVVARIDFIYSSAEAQRDNTISGSYQEGFSVKCVKDCAYIELDDLENSGRKSRGSFEGKQWISGKYQEVRGGEGCLSTVNGSQEPTGRHPFGPAFKVVVMEPDETTDEVDTALYFRFCTPCGCTPYFIGPVPWLSYKVNMPIFVGSLSWEKQASGTSTPTGAQKGETPAFKGAEFLSGIGTGTAQSGNLPLCSGQVVENINVDALAHAIQSIESAGSGGYQAVGVYTCADGGQNCGRGLGKYQFMNYNPYAASRIAAKPGGQGFLSKLKGGYQPTQQELFQYFPPDDQEAAFQQSIAEKIPITAKQIDPTTGKPFTGDRLIERIAQKHFGGDYSKVDGGASDALGRLSLKDYGAKTREVYKQEKGTNCNQATADSAQSGGGSATGNYINPAPGYSVTSEMGHRHSPCAGCSSFHKGIDLGTPTGTPIKAADGGIVIYSGTARGYGNVVIIDHGGGKQTRYAHLSAMDVPVGTKVGQGQVIGKAGSTGVGTGAHLHFEIREGATPGQPFSGNAINPRQYVKF